MDPRCEADVLGSGSLDVEPVRLWVNRGIAVRDAVKKALPKDAPKPGKFRLADGGGEQAPAAEAPAEQEGV